MIYLLRHGKVDLQGKKCFIGQTDLPLNSDGLRQARHWREKLRAIAFDGIYSSDLRRAVQTARIITENSNTDIHVMPRLREIHLGDWEGLPMSEIREIFPGEWRKRGENLESYRPPGGESFADLYARVVPVFRQIAEQSCENRLIIAHAGVNRAILCYVLGMPLANLFRLGQDYGSLNLIERKKDFFRIIAMNIQQI
ncbi:alpha-ribazole phosphatase [Desulfococcaceae bacterium HSG8]|nr:alpha-ribazole phosphatase [Desulfococcaceae bacterium HSG8]